MKRETLIYIGPNSLIEIYVKALSYQFNVMIDKSLKPNEWYMISSGPNNGGRTLKTHPQSGPAIFGCDLASGSDETKMVTWRFYAEPNGQGGTGGTGAIEIERCTKCGEVQRKKFKAPNLNCSKCISFNCIVVEYCSEEQLEKYEKKIMIRHCEICNHRYEPKKLVLVQSCSRCDRYWHQGHEEWTVSKWNKFKNDRTIEGAVESMIESRKAEFERQQKRDQDDLWTCKNGHQEGNSKRKGVAYCKTCGTLRQFNVLDRQFSGRFIDDLLIERGSILTKLSSPVAIQHKHVLYHHLEKIDSEIITRLMDKTCKPYTACKMIKDAQHAGECRCLDDYYVKQIVKDVFADPMHAVRIEELKAIIATQTEKLRQTVPKQTIRQRLEEEKRGLLEELVPRHSIERSIYIQKRVQWIDKRLADNAVYLLGEQSEELKSTIRMREKVSKSINTGEVLDKIISQLKSKILPSGQKLDEIRNDLDAMHCADEFFEQSNKLMNASNTKLVSAEVKITSTKSLHTHMLIDGCKRYEGMKQTIYSVYKMDGLYLMLEAFK